MLQNTPKKTSYEINPAKIVIYSFLIVIAAGALLLKMPGSTTGGHLSWLNAFFMSTSAVCVTGLSVIDVGTQLTFPGQVILLGLIQAGGLGIMTFSLFFMIFLKGGTSLATRLSASGVSKKSDIQSLMSVLPLILGMTLLFEALGAGFLFLRLRQLHNFHDAVFSSVFHSVSAFCNAGFSLYRDSLARFQGDIFFPIVIMALIIFGGLGFIVIDEVRMWGRARFQGGKFRLSLHTKVCLIGTLALVVFGAAAVFFLENKNLLEGMPLSGKLMNAFFLSVTSRTAGFNIIDTALLTNASLFFMILYMFIGGCPGSTAGGIKVTTFATLLALIKCQVQGSPMTAILNRKIPKEVVGKALAVFAAGFVIVIAATLIFEASERTGVSHGMSKGSFLEILFEVTSALGTVGLSTGVTSTLTPLGKFMTILLMLAGRVGPLTVGVAVMNRKRKQIVYEYAEEEMMIG